MATNSGIQWTNHTWNPWHGCHKVSLGCAKCYMFRDKKRFGQNPNVVVRANNFSTPVHWLKSGKAKSGDKVFTCSWSDFLIEEADEWRDEALAIIRQTPELTYQILTKRIERGLEIDWPANVWLGVSCENQETANERIWRLLMTNAYLKWVSLEPLLEPINLQRICDDFPGLVFDALSKKIGISFRGKGLDWVVVGGESDNIKPRRCDVFWIESIIRQCKDANVPIFLKQLGGTRKINGAWGGDEINGKKYQEWPK